MIYKALGIIIVLIFVFFTVPKPLLAQADDSEEPSVETSASDTTRDTTSAAAPSSQQEQQPQQTAPPAQPEKPVQTIETWGAVEAGKGFLVGKTEFGELYISAYALVRYLNQLPANQTFTDHLGRVHDIDTRNDIYAHRIMMFLKGWMALPKLKYQIILWTVNTTDQKALFAALGYQFSRKFSLYAGLNALPGTRSLQGSHPYWLGNDRVMADEFFRPYFTHGIWASGEPVPGLWYNVMAGNNLSALGITAKQLTRQLATGGSIWWMPTTKEFGPQGGVRRFREPRTRCDTVRHLHDAKP